MIETAINYVVQTAEGGWRIADSRISLDSVVHAYWEGQSPETIVKDFPTLSLEQIHGALAFYLRHREEMDRYLESQDARWEQLRKESEAVHGSLLSSLRSRRRTTSKPEATP